MRNTAITYKKPLKLLTKIIINYFLGDKKSQNCLVVGRTPVKNSQNSLQLASLRLKNHKLVNSWPDPYPPVLVVKIKSYQPYVALNFFKHIGSNRDRRNKALNVRSYKKNMDKHSVSLEVLFIFGWFQLDWCNVSREEPNKTKIEYCISKIICFLTTFRIYLKLLS